jgi:RNA polymerase sigma-70 factor, ECF subfamily
VLVADALAAHREALEVFVGARVAPSEIEDVLQIASLRAIERAEGLDDPDRVLAWLRRIVRNVIVDEARARQARARRLATAAAEAATSVGGEEEPCHCSARLAGELPPPYAAVLRLVDLGDASVSEAAARLGITTNNATVRLHRARKSLRAKLREHCGVASAVACRDCRCTYDGCCG